MFFSCECCMFSGRGLRVGADDSSRGVQPSVVCKMSVIVKLHKRKPRPGIGSKHKGGGKGGHGRDIHVIYQSPHYVIFCILLYCFLSDYIFDALIIIYS